MSNDLEELRTKIDAIDIQLVELLAQRFQVTEQVGILKSKSGTPPQDLEREAKQFEKLTVLAMQAGVDPEAIQAIWRTIIDEVIKRHQQIQAEENAKN